MEVAFNETISNRRSQCVHVLEAQEDPVAEDDADEESFESAMEETTSKMSGWFWTPSKTKAPKTLT